MGRKPRRSTPVPIGDGTPARSAVTTPPSLAKAPALHPEAAPPEPHLRRSTPPPAASSFCPCVSASRPSVEVTEVHGALSEGGTIRDALSVVNLEDGPAFCGRFSGGGGGIEEQVTAGQSFAAKAAVSSLRHGDAADSSSDFGVVGARHVLYYRNWAQVVLGATSGIMFLLVVGIGYALYVLVTPYSKSITNGILLSIVLHPRSRVRSAQYMSAAVERMDRVQRHWAAQGRVMGIVGSWISLRHFFSYVVMQGAIFLGLHKIRVHAGSVLLGAATAKVPDATPAALASSQATITTSTSSSPSSAFPPSTAARQKCHGAKNSPAAAVVSRRNGTARTREPAPTSPAVLAVSQQPPQKTAPPHRRLVATPRGRLVLRWLTLGILVAVAHLLISIIYFAVVHLALAIALAFLVPLVPTRSFVRTMGRLWQSTVIIFFVVGLTLNLTADVLSISEAVRRTTSAVVGGGSGGDGTHHIRARPILHTGDPTVEMTPMDALWNNSAVVSMYGTCAERAAAQDDDANGDSKNSQMGMNITGTHESIFGKSVAGDAGDSGGGVDAFRVWDQYRSRFEAVLVSKLQDIIIQELADMFSDGNVTQMLDTLLQILPPQLRVVVERDAGGERRWGDGTEGNHRRSRQGALAAEAGVAGSKAPVTGDAELSLDSGSTAILSTSTSWWMTWERVRRLRPSGLVKSLVYNSLLGSPAQTDNGAAVVGRKVETDWLTVSRLIASRLLHYTEYALRLCISVGANLLGLFDNLYAFMLFIFFYRYLAQLDHTVLYYGAAKLLHVVEPALGDAHARNIEQDITVSLITLLQSFWHLTWFHFCITFGVLKCWGFPTPFLLGLVSVVLALFPLVPKWLSPCSITFVYMLVQLVSLTTSEERTVLRASGPGEGAARVASGAASGSLFATASAQVNVPLFAFPPGHSWVDMLVMGKPYVLHYVRAASFALAVVLECGDEWLLCVSRELHGGFAANAVPKGSEQLQPFVIGTALVLGFVSYGMRGIVFGPLTVIVARVLFDNWDMVLMHRELRDASRHLAEEEDDDEEDDVEDAQGVKVKTCIGKDLPPKIHAR